jgi:hypothetical protein
VRGALASHLGSRQVARVLYGSIIGLALVLALQHHGATDGEVVAALVGTAVAVGLAEVYSDVLGTATRTHRRVGRDQLGEISSDAAATGAGVAFPSVYFAAAALGAMETDAAFTVAKWSGIGLITAYGFAAARLTGSSLMESLLRAAAAAGIAGFLIVVKALLH